MSAIKFLKDSKWKMLEENLTLTPNDQELRNKFYLHCKSILQNNGYYQMRDLFLRDYNPVIFEGFDTTKILGKELISRGPTNWRQSQKFALFAGAADLFGAMVQKPIPSLVEEKLNLNVVNLSIGGASIELFANDNSNFVNIANLAEFVCLSVTSLRSVTPISLELVQRSPRMHKHLQTGELLNTRKYLTTLFRQDRKEFISEIKLIMEKKLSAYRSLKQKIKAPIFLFYLPNKSSPLSQNLEKFEKINLKGFPHFITNDYLEELSRIFGGIIKPEITSGNNFAIDRFSHQKIEWHNGKFEGNYYPSAETHEDAFFQFISRL